MTTPDLIAHLRRTRPGLSELQRIKVALAVMRVVKRVPARHAREAVAICLGVAP